MPAFFFVLLSGFISQELPLTPTPLPPAGEGLTPRERKHC